VLSRIRYTIREMWASLSRNLTLTVAAVITSAVSLLLFGLTFLLRESFDNQLDQWSGGVEMIVYVNNGAEPEQIDLVERALTDQTTIISSVSYCDIGCSLDTAARLFSGDTSALERLNADNIPSFFSVVPVDPDNTELLRQVSAGFEELPQVNAVAFPDEKIDTLRALKGVFGPRTLVMAFALLAAASLLIWNTIRTAMFARRREIEVMKLVGATNWFIRLPFMLEGLLQGLAGGMVASAGLLFLNSDWTRGVRGLPADSGFESFVVIGSYPWQVVAYMLTLGAVVGAVGSATAASRFLDV